MSEEELYRLWSLASFGLQLSTAPSPFGRGIQMDGSTISLLLILLEAGPFILRLAGQRWHMRLFSARGSTLATQVTESLTTRRLSSSALS